MRNKIVLAIGLILLFSAGAFLVWRGRTVSPAAPISAPEAISPEAMHAAWRTRVSEILKTYDGDGNAQAAQDAITGLRVAAADRDIHLQLVLAFASVVQGDKGGAEKLKKARADFEAQK